jgi:hypothetical protein
MLDDRLSEVVDRAATELTLIEAELRRRSYQTNPTLWARDRLGDVLWSAQTKILNSVRDNRKTAVMSCHEIGKSFIASRAAGWWLDTHPPGEAFVVTSAPSASQVRSILWREIGRMHAKGNLPGRVNQTSWYMTMPAGNEELVAIGRKPDEYDPTAFQGIHARYVLYIFDEANGIRGNLHEAADSLIANDEGKALLISNPDDPAGEFYEMCKPGSGVNVISISAFDSPNFTGEPLPDAIKRQLIGRVYVEEKRRKWAPFWEWNKEDTAVAPLNGNGMSGVNPMWMSKVLGQFPEVPEAGGLIPITWIKAAQSRNLDPTNPSELGVDVGGGGDSSCIAHRRGPVVRIMLEDHNPDTMQTCGNVVANLKSCGASIAKVDEIGIGRGVVDRGKEQELPIIGINVGGSPIDKEAFANLRAELWWNVRERFESGEVDLDPLDDDLAAELCSLKYRRTSNGKIQIESKEEAKKRGIPSPNRADAVMLAFAVPKSVPEEFFVW